MRSVYVSVWNATLTKLKNLKRFEIYLNIQRRIFLMLISMLPHYHSKQTTFYSLWHPHSLDISEKTRSHCYLKRTRPSGEGESLTCGVAPGRCRCQFASSPCAVSCRIWQLWVQGSPVLLPWWQVGLCPAGRQLELAAQAFQQQPNVIKQRAASAASPVEQRIIAWCSSLEKLLLPGSALKPQHTAAPPLPLEAQIKVGSRVQRWPSCHP